MGTTSLNLPTGPTNSRLSCSVLYAAPPVSTRTPGSSTPTGTPERYRLTVGVGVSASFRDGCISEVNFEDDFRDLAAGGSAGPRIHFREYEGPSAAQTRASSRRPAGPVGWRDQRLHPCSRHRSSLS